jgi:hypothetical protein
VNAYGTNSPASTRGKHEVRSKHADHAVTFAVQTQIAFEDFRIRVEAIAPQRIGKYDDAVASNDRVVRSEHAAERRANPERGKERRRRAHTLQAFGRATFGEIEARVDIQRAVFERGRLRVQVEVIRNRHRVEAATEFRHARIDVDERIGLPIRQIAHVYAVDQREHERIRADAQREREDRGDRKSRLAQQHARSVTQVLQKMRQHD